jgi:sugar phosphate isomerase/epimerase
MAMHYARMTGIGDEGGAGIAEQIAINSELGWGTIELRNVDGKNICEMDDESFDAIRAAMDKAGLRASGFGSAIANWARPIGTPFERDMGDLRRAVPRMRALGTSFIRIMSYPNDGRDEALWKKEVFRRMKELVTVADGEGIVLLHENCDGWASATPERLAELLSYFNSPALRIVFDTGNPIGHGGSLEDTWAFYKAALPYIVHFHIKDCKRLMDGRLEHVMPGDGDCDVVAIMRDLLGTGYTGLFSIEPHIAVQVHLGGTPVEGMDPGSIYREYGRRANRIWDSIMAAEA